ncbi:MAG: MauE/DoxX family redox-associated membrane protein [Gaiellaceae bacterium]
MSSSELGEFAALTGRYGLAFVFLGASIPKLLARADFQAALANYRILPDRLVAPVAQWLPRIELTAAAALFAGVFQTTVGLAVAALLLVFAGAVAVNIARGRQIDCGCSGFTARRTISWPAVARNVALAGVAVTAAIWSASGSDASAALVVGGSVVLANLVLGESRRLRSGLLEFTERVADARTA